MQTKSAIHLERSDYDAAIQAVSRSFLNDPIIRYFHADSQEAVLTTNQLIGRVLLRYCEPYHQIYTTAEIDGVAVWVPPHQLPINNWRLLRLGLYQLLFQLPWQKLPQLLNLYSRLERYHQQDAPEPHWYLMLLGIAPEAQGQGVGGALLDPVLQQADREGVTCYLETSTERAVRFYQKHGFEILRTGEVAQNAPRYWTMKRNPMPGK